MCTLRSFSRAVCLTALLSVALLGQSDRGTITGTIADPANAVVPGAKVTVKNSETGTVATTLTTPTGNYTLVSLPAGVYELTVEAPGFKKTTQTGVQVQVAQISRLDISLQVGAATESISVTAEAPMMKTENAEQSINVSGERINNLPINFGGGGGNTGNVRSWTAFAMLSPGSCRYGREQPYQRCCGGELQDYRRGPGSHQPESGHLDQYRQPGVSRANRRVLTPNQ